MDGGEVPGIKSGRNEIETLAGKVERLVLCSKDGDWPTVWSILGTPENMKECFLINAIPQHRRWGVLHQAVYWRIPEVLRYILSFPACDPGVKAKQCESECGPTGKMNALQIAREYHFDEMASILSEERACPVLTQDIPTFQPYAGYSDDTGLSLITLTLASYKEAFHPGVVPANKSLLQILSKIFDDIKQGSRWISIKNIVTDSVFPVSPEKARDINQCETKEKFFSQVIRSYTNEDNTIYAYMNMAFRRQRQHNYMPSGDDLAMGPYCVMYQILLLFWSELRAENKITYRKMKMSRSNVDKYTPGSRFVWQSVVSSATSPDHTHAFPSMGPSGDVTVLFTIDNSTESLWRPRDIEAHADFPETERTYPAGAKFIVSGRSGVQDNVSISLKLM